MTAKIMDAQAALGFVLSQRTHIETEVLKKPYPSIAYMNHVPVDTSANSYAPSVTFFTTDSVGKAKLINGKGDDVPLVNIVGSKFEQTVNMGAIGYSFTLDEIGAASQMGQSLSTEGASAARMAYEQLVDEFTYLGDASIGVEGLLNTAAITSQAAAKTFAASTPQEILAEINKHITAIWTASKGIELVDTLLLPMAEYGAIATRTLSNDNSMTILEFIRKANVYSVKAGQALSIEASHRLTSKMVFYRRDPEVLKLHMPMPLTFIPPQARGLSIDTFGMFRFSPVNIRRPGAMKYVTGI